MDFEKLGIFYLGEAIDTETNQPTRYPYTFESSNLTTHAVIVGMTGSGKTGLGVGLIEEAALDRIPVLAIDPKGDLANLALTFPEFTAQDFIPWVDPASAKQKGLDIEQYAQKEADKWRGGLEASGQSGDRIKKLQETRVTVYTPGSTAGIPISILQSLEPPPMSQQNFDSEAFIEKIGGTVDSILTLIDIDSDPFSREHVLLSTIIQDRWSAGLSTSLIELVQLVQRPPFTQVGAFDLETFFPTRGRQGLALKLNAILAAPTFQNWLTGVPLDIDQLLFDDMGNPKIAVISLNHLSDREQHFFLTLLLTEFNAWTRSQSGTGSLRALLYMDEMFGFLPPVAEPATKKPLLSLLKQARAFGVGLALSTQNPVDIDYKALGNAGTWFIGRLQTERDRARLLQGLSTGATGETADIMQQIATLGKRQFLVHNVSQKAPELFYTRWTMSYLAGPLTLNQIGKLEQESVLGTQRMHHQARLKSPYSTTAPPAIPPEIPQRFVGTGEFYEPFILAKAEVHYSSKTYNLDHTTQVSRVLQIPPDTIPQSWSEGVPYRVPSDGLDHSASKGTEYAPLPPFPSGASALKSWEQSFKRWLQGDGALKLWSHPELKLNGLPDESESAFRRRCDVAIHELRDAKRQRIQDKFATRFRTLERRLLSQQQALSKQEESQKQLQLDTYITLGSTLLSSLLSGRKPTSSSVSTTLRKVTGQSRRRVNVEAAEEQIDFTQQELIALQETVDSELSVLTDEVTALQNRPLNTVSVRPILSSIHVTYLGLLWMS